MITFLYCILRKQPYGKAQFTCTILTGSLVGLQATDELTLDACDAQTALLQHTLQVCHLGKTI